MTGRAKPITIDLAELAIALEDHSGLVWYLDAKSGDLVPLSDDAGDDDLPTPRDEIENSVRFTFVEALESREEWEEMRDFTTTVADRRMRELLEVALAGKGAFRRFRDVLASHAEERARWIAEHDRRMQERAREWLDAHEIAWTPRRESRQRARRRSGNRPSPGATGRRGNRPRLAHGRPESARDARCARVATWTGSGSRSHPKARGSPASPWT